MSTDLLVVDFDGVVADSMPLHAEAWSFAVQRVFDDDPHVHQAVMRNLYSGYARERMFQGLGLSPSRVSDLRRIKDARWIELREQVPVHKGVERYLPRIAERLPVVIATAAGREYVDGVLVRHGIDSLFAWVVSDRDVDRPKPAPDMLVEAGRRFDVPLDRVLMVGDTVTDYEMAKSAQVPFLWMRADVEWIDDSKLTGADSIEGWTALASRLGIDGT